MVVSTTRRVGGLAVLACAVAIVWGAAAPTASAAPTMTTVRLGVTGMVTPSAPHGAWTITARPGQTLGFLAGLVPGLNQLAVKKILDVQVSMDAARLPGGSHGKTLNAHNPYRVTLRKPGVYPVTWTVAFVLDHGHRSTVEATRDFHAMILVAPSTGRDNNPGLVSSGVVPPAAGRPSSTVPTAASRVTTPHVSAAAPVPSATPTITLPPDTGAPTHPKPGTLAALPLATPADTYLFTALVGTFVIGMLWLLWVASIKPILGR
jgi:hypothetical protein